MEAKKEIFICKEMLVFAFLEGVSSVRNMPSCCLLALLTFSKIKIKDAGEGTNVHGSEPVPWMFLQP